MAELSSIDSAAQSGSRSIGKGPEASIISKTFPAYLIGNLRSVPSAGAGTVEPQPFPRRLLERGFRVICPEYRFKSRANPYVQDRDRPLLSSV